ncbi:class II aldolase/adducin family protein [Kineosporia sp. J2-2]|uniref:Class II aldolase/adducin family protein n=1 Tax=Kineosporia corallincola TaxID=2835133 RepID=A0ABS5TKB6_9ACTN|nr:PfkB family carbohydrate kinase [Kineosporia corallincola]MBT0771544.1 class II aldolase/adducin family protein [Kineosporia corallincola]
MSVHRPPGRIAVLGPHIVDVLGRPVGEIPPGQGGILLDEIRMTVAGTGGGVAVDLAKLGRRVSVFGAVGDDALGGFLHSRLRSYGVDTAGLVAKTGVVTSSTILPIRANGERPSMHVLGATGLLRVADIDRAALHSAEALFLGGPETMPALLEPDGLELIRGFRAGGRPVFADCLYGGDPETLTRLTGLLPLLDWFLPNDDQLRALTGIHDLPTAARRLIELGAGAVAVTMGGDGTLLVRPDHADVVVPAYATTVVDTTGCGDSFDAGLVTGLLAGCAPEDAARLGNACGSLVATGLGSDAGIVDLDGVVAVIETADPESASRIRELVPPADDLHRMREEVAATCREVAARGVAVGGAGNISLRVGDQVLITRSGLRLEAATASDISVVTLDGDLVRGARPSSETGLHLGIYRRSGTGAVVHTHGMSSVAVGLVADELPRVHYNILRLGGRVPTVAHHVFGSAELARATGDAVAAGARAVLLRNHGSVSCGTTLDDAVENAELTEWLCDVYLSAARLGSPALLTPDDLEAVAGQATRLGYGER